MKVCKCVLFGLLTVWLSGRLHEHLCELDRYYFLTLVRNYTTPNCHSKLTTKSRFGEGFQTTQAFFFFFCFGAHNDTVEQANDFILLKQNNNDFIITGSYVMGAFIAQIRSQWRQLCSLPNSNKVIARSSLLKIMCNKLVCSDAGFRWREQNCK